MGLTNFIDILNFIQSQGYFVLLFLMIIEGPIVTTAAAFAASFGYFNVLLVLLLSIIGDVLGDIIYFEIGRKVRAPLIEKYVGKLKVRKKVINELEEGLKTHLIKSITLMKFTPFLCNMGLMLAGALKTTRKRFIIASLLVTVPRAICFTIVGYYLGVAINPIIKYYNLTGYFLLVIVLFMIIFYLVYRWFFRKVGSIYVKRSKDKKIRISE